jgi:arylsulfatase A-like enzyme
LDEQVGRLRRELNDLGVADNTMFWFCADNGPEGKEENDRTPGSAGPFRGRKRDLFEGGVRVPGILEWPARVGAARAVDMPCCTSDYFPTILDVVGMPESDFIAPRDGISLVPLIEAKMARRPVPIGFESHKRVALSDNRYKLISTDNGKSFMLFDLLDDPGETRDLAATRPEIVRSMRAILDQWRASCKRSLAGMDY